MKFFKALLGMASIILLLAATAPAGVEPCALIIRDQAAAILGEPVKAPRSGKVAGMASGVKCDYYTAAPLAKRGGVGMVQLILYTKDTLKGGLFSSPEDYFERRLKAGQKAGGKVEDVAGLGGRAYWDVKSNVLHILAKGLYLQLRISGLKKISVKGGRDELMQKISQHRKQLSINAAQKYLMPKL